MNKKITLAELEAILPQTQCGLCEYPGCKPYAEAILNGETINRCLPGGVPTLKNLAELLQQDPTPFLAEMRQKAKPPMLAYIRENECIGCTKCIQACPVDAIVGAAKHMHTVLMTECTGCELCVTPCPVDCIEMRVIPENTYSPELAKQRYEAKTQRLSLAEQEKLKKLQTKKLYPAQTNTTKAIDKSSLMEAVLRARSKKKEF